MQMLRTLPLFGLIPVFIVWFGIGELPKVLLIAMGAAIPPSPSCAGSGSRSPRAAPPITTCSPC